MSPTLPAAPKQPTRTGWALLLTSVAFFMVITAASIGEHFGRRRVYVAGLALFSLASAACALAPSTTLLIATRVAPRDMGTASGMLNMLQRFGGVVAVAVASAVFASNAHLGTAVSFDNGFRPALLEWPACPSLALSLPSPEGAQAFLIFKAAWRQQDWAVSAGPGRTRPAVIGTLHSVMQPRWHQDSR